MKNGVKFIIAALVIIVIALAVNGGFEGLKKAGQASNPSTPAPQTAAH